MSSLPRPCNVREMHSSKWRGIKRLLRSSIRRWLRTTTTESMSMNAAKKLQKDKENKDYVNPEMAEEHR